MHMIQESRPLSLDMTGNSANFLIRDTSDTGSNSSMADLDMIKQLLEVARAVNDTDPATLEKRLVSILGQDKPHVTLSDHNRVGLLLSELHRLINKGNTGPLLEAFMDLEVARGRLSELYKVIKFNNMIIANAYVQIECHAIITQSL